ncbi:MAG: ATP-binding protein [Actinomycetes bacterium]|mgnify:CR=1 FL=1|jgi:anti-sigma regulatory factor (Ser/Thr protein kinase)|nr:MAG: ATP-binding protein [Actinomycetota bacterium]
MSADTGDLLGAITLAGRPESASAARVFVEKVLGAAHPALDDAKLLASELVANSAVHSDSRGDGEITVEISRTASRGRIRIGVIDQGSTARPRVRNAPDDVTGRGLFLVAALSRRWGVTDREAAREVWFEIDDGA